MEMEARMALGPSKRKRATVEAHFLDRGKWWVAWTDDVPGAVTQGQTLDEARENLKDAIALMREPVDLESLSPESGKLVHERLAL
jgi:predicted RNase H-like HicB family nuclease